jgi:glycosyltransferase involved in cell wall biosynthesis
MTCKDGFSGINGPIINEMNKYYNLVSEIDPFENIFIDLLIKIKSFSISYYKWREKYYYLSENYQMTSKSFYHRNKSCSKKLSKINKRYDFIFQISHMFYPDVYLNVDRTTKLREKIDPSSFASIDVDELNKYHNLTQISFNKCTKIFTFNEIVRESVINDYNIESHKVINVGSGVNVDNLVEHEKKNNQQIIFVGSDYKRHGADFALEVFRLIHKNNNDIRLVFVGKKLDANMSYIQSYHHVPKSQLLDLLEQSNVLIMPAKIGGFQSITEAMSKKCIPIVSLENPYVKELVVEGETGLYADGNNALDWAEKAKMILDVTEMQSKLSDGAFKKIVADHTWESAIYKIMKEIT